MNQQLSIGKWLWVTNELTIAHSSETRAQDKIWEIDNKRVRNWRPIDSWADLSVSQVVCEDARAQPPLEDAEE